VSRSVPLLGVLASWSDADLLRAMVPANVSLFEAATTVWVLVCLGADSNQSNTLAPSSLVESPQMLRFLSLLKRFRS